jgi:hypothetical protein
MDIFTTKKRSAIMRNIKSKKNKSTELRLIELFRRFGIKGWKRNYPVKGHPDFVFLSLKIAVFVDGCFWHGHDCRNTHPADNEDFWKKKQDRSRRHDQEITELFRLRGWSVVRIWECELKKKNEHILKEKLAALL